jgi:hypothetical protein
MNSFPTLALSLGLALSLDLLGSVAAGAGTAPSIEEFAARSRIEDVTISPSAGVSAVTSRCSARNATRICFAVPSTSPVSAI